MEYRKMASTGDELSVLGYGCMRFPEKNGGIDRKRAEQQICTAIEQGVNYFDTAFPYHMGHSEPFLGKVLAKGLRNRVHIATKLPPASVRGHEDMDKILDNQLKRLQTDHIDYYLLHGIERQAWKKLRDLDVLAFLERARRAGRIRHAGFSFHGTPDAFEEIVDAHDWQFCQIQYNYFDQDIQAGTRVLEYAAAKGLGIVIMEPMRGGLITTRVPKAVSKIWAGAPKKRSPAEWSLRWIWNRPDVHVVLSGMNEEAHIEENIRIAGQARPLSLSQTELALVEEARQAFHTLMKIGCTGCRYCMPCPAGVDIPFCFDLYNRVRSFNEIKFHNMARYAIHLGGIEGEKCFASNCVECGKCVEKCPQGLDIPMHLKSVAKEFETLVFKLFLLYGRFFFSRIR